MFDTNIKIINNFRDFVRVVSENRILLDLFSNSNKAFTRKRKLSFDRLVFFIARLNKKTLSIELENFFEMMGVLPLCTVSAFSQQRIKLCASFYNSWNMVLCKSFYEYAEPSVQRWRGYRVMAADGSTISLINNKSLNNYFGEQGNQSKKYVIARTFYHYDVLNELIVLSKIKPHCHGELSLACDAVKMIEEDTIAHWRENERCLVRWPSRA